jgi:hypothetical protein
LRHVFYVPIEALNVYSGVKNVRAVSGNIGEDVKNLSFVTFFRSSSRFGRSILTKKYPRLRQGRPTKR